MKDKEADRKKGRKRQEDIEKGIIGKERTNERGRKDDVFVTDNPVLVLIHSSHQLATEGFRS